MKWILSAVSFVALIGLLSCGGEGANGIPSWCEIDSTSCDCDATQAKCIIVDGVAHKAGLITNSVVALPTGLTMAVTTKQIQDFLGVTQFKLAFRHQLKLYLLLPAADVNVAPEVIKLSQENESFDGTPGIPAEPIFSPDGRYVAYAGTIGSAPKTVLSFVHVAEKGSVYRQPIDTTLNKKAYSPHWYASGSDLYIVYIDKFGINSWNFESNSYIGETYMVKVISDSTMGVPEEAVINGANIPGAFKGGVSKDSGWVGSTYGATVLFNTATQTSIVLNNGNQQCNASMNPFPAGGINNDYMMILGFGGEAPVPAIGGNVLESQHQHLWVWDSDNNAVWKAALPAGYEGGEWQKPEWSTHKNFATSIAAKARSSVYDLFIVKMTATGDELVNNTESALLTKAGELKVIEGNFGGSDWQHLWVGN